MKKRQKQAYKSNRKRAKAKKQKLAIHKTLARQTKTKPAKSKDKNKRKQDGRPILLTRITLRVLFRLPKPLNRICIVYYLFLLLLCVERKTNRVWCNDTYAAEGLNCSEGLVGKAKAQLAKLGYIRIEQEHIDKDGHFGKVYIVCKHYARRSTIDEALGLYSRPSCSGNFRSKEAILAEIEKKMDEELEDLQRRANKRMTKRARREIRARREQSTVTTKNIATGSKVKKAGSSKKTTIKANEPVATKNIATVKKKQSTVTTFSRDAVKHSTNTYRAKEDNTYRAKENTLAKKHRKSESVSESLFDDDKTKLNKQKLKDSFEYKCSVKLAKAVKSPKAKHCHPIQRKANILEWSKEFRKLHVKDRIEKDAIEYVLDWYCLHIGEAHIPEAFCGESFREKFGQIVSAMVRAGDFDREDCGQIGSEDDEDDFDDVRTVVPEPKTHTTEGGLEITRTFEDAYDGALRYKDVWIDSDGVRRGIGSILDSDDDPYEFDDERYDDYEPPNYDDDD